MSDHNVEFVRGRYPANDVDLVRLFGDPDRARAVWGPWLHPDFESVSDPHAPGLSGRRAGEIRATGIDAFVRAWQDVVSAFETLSMTPTEFIALPDDRVFVPSEFRAKPKTGGVDLAFGGAIIWTIEDGLVRTLEVWFDRARALEAAGLSR